VVEIQSAQATQLFTTTGTTGAAVQGHGHDIAVACVQGSHIGRDRVNASVV
jgi:hypothetical protein